VGHLKKKKKKNKRAFVSKISIGPELLMKKRVPCHLYRPQGGGVRKREKERRCSWAADEFNNTQDTSAFPGYTGAQSATKS